MANQSSHSSAFCTTLGITSIAVALVSGVMGCVPKSLRTEDSRVHLNRATQLNQAEASEGVTAWVELGPHSQVIARVITDAKTCPKISMRDAKGRTQSQEMETRVFPSSDDFPVRTCEFTIPKKITHAEILRQNADPVSLPLPKKKLQRIVMIGDTGCRISVFKGGKFIQNCNDSDEWPLEKVSKAIALLKPDLVIHMGDYIYRLSPCPDTHAKWCSGSPVGDHWETWKADFFKPTAELRAAVPFVFVRGNHEKCSRAGKGWFRFLDPFPFKEGCENYSEPYLVTVANQNVIVMDSSSADDTHVTQKKTKQFSTQFKKMNREMKGPKWLLSHAPVWSVGEMTAAVSRDNPVPQIESTWTRTNADLQASLKVTPLQNLEIAFAGHIHIFEALNFKDQGPSQIIVGNGGSALYPQHSDLSGKEVGGRVVHQGWVANGFGYSVLEPKKNGQNRTWSLQSFSISGDLLKSCQLRKNQVQCE